MSLVYDKGFHCEAAYPTMHSTEYWQLAVVTAMLQAVPMSSNLMLARSLT